MNKMIQIQDGETLESLIQKIEKIGFQLKFRQDMDLDIMIDIKNDISLKNLIEYFSKTLNLFFFVQNKEIVFSSNIKEYLCFNIFYNNIEFYNCIQQYLNKIAICNYDEKTGKILIETETRFANLVIDYMDSLEQKQICLEVRVIEISKNNTKFSWINLIKDMTNEVDFSSFTKEDFSSTFYKNIKNKLNYHNNTVFTKQNFFINISSLISIYILSGNSGTFKSSTKTIYRLGQEVITKYKKVNKQKEFCDETGIQIAVKALVAQDNKIIIDINCSVSKNPNSSMHTTITQSNNINTVIRTTNGESIVIGGLNSSEKIKNKERIGWLPNFLQKIFHNDSTKTIDTEIIIIIKTIIV